MGHDECAASGGALLGGFGVGARGQDSAADVGGAALRVDCEAMALRNDEPMRRNSPTVKGLVVQDERDLGMERERLLALIDRFAAAGPAGCTKHPHSFFGRLTPDEWAILMYKHLDHHLRQFGV